MDVNFVVLGAACHTSVLRVLGDCCVTCHFYNGIYQFLIYAINLWRFFTLGAFFVVYIRHDMTLHALTFLFRGFQIPWQLGAMHLKYEQIIIFITSMDSWCTLYIWKAQADMLTYSALVFQWSGFKRFLLLKLIERTL